MTSIEFTIWLKGFMTACNEYSPTPKQWDIIKEELDKVSDNTGTPIGIGGWGTPNMAPITPTPYVPPYQPDPYNPYKVYCGDVNTGTYTPGYSITTTPGHGYITIHNPNLVSWGTGSLTTTTNAKFPISGSNVTYTTYQPYTTGADENIKKIKNK
jgi:hypothetical protein